jgi:hypothetical protein
MGQKWSSPIKFCVRIRTMPTVVGILNLPIVASIGTVFNVGLEGTAEFLRRIRKGTGEGFGIAWLRITIADITSVSASVTVLVLVALTETLLEEGSDIICDPL